MLRQDGHAHYEQDDREEAVGVRRRARRRKRTVFRRAERISFKSLPCVRGDGRHRRRGQPKDYGRPYRDGDSPPRNGKGHRLPEFRLALQEGGGNTLLIGAQDDDKRHRAGRRLPRPHQGRVRQAALRPLGQKLYVRTRTRARRVRKGRAQSNRARLQED